jgi:hypothetical protein
MKYSMIIQYNGRMGGAHKTWAGEVEAESVGEAMELGCAQVVRDPNVGGSIYVTGVIIMELRD